MGRNNQIFVISCRKAEKDGEYLDNRVYLDSISNWFGPYKDHAAVKMTKRLITEKYFFHIRPLKAILDLENIQNDPSHDLNLWAKETVRVAEESGFDAFLPWGSRTNMPIVLSIRLSRGI